MNYTLNQIYIISLRKTHPKVLQWNLLKQSSLDKKATKLNPKKCGDTLNIVLNFFDLSIDYDLFSKINPIDLSALECMIRCVIVKC